MEYIAKVIGEYAFFLDNYGNYTLIPLFAMVFILDWKVGNSKLSKRQKQIIRPLFTLSAVVLGTVIFLINISFKPMVTSLSKVDQSIGTEMVHFEYLNVITGEMESLESYSEKIVLLNFWGTFCPPCIQEFPDLKRLENEFTNDLVVIAVSAENPERIQKFIAKVESPSIVGSQPGYQWINPEKFLPLTIVINKGEVADRFFGRRTYEEFAEVIARVKSE